MTSWDIHPAGVNAVVTSTQAAAQGFDPELRQMNTAIAGAGAESSSPIVVSALQGLEAALQGEIQFVSTRCSAALSGAVAATNAYLHGDLAMAANAQRNAGTAPNPEGTMPGRSGPR